MVWVAVPVGSLAGVVVGSYVTTATLRAARCEQSFAGRSHCDHCGVRLGFLQTVPIVSYLTSRGVCRSCNGRIDPLHAVGEIAGGAIGGIAALASSGVQAALVAALGFTLLALAVFDARTRRLPDQLTFIAALVAVILSLRHGGPAFAVGVAAAAVAGIILWSLRALRAHQGRDPGVGWGDVKLIGALALWLGILTSWMVLLAAILGLLALRVIRPSDNRMAFGPAIALAGFTIGVGMEVGLWPAAT